MTAWLVLLALLVGNAPPDASPGTPPGPGWRCEPERVPACREIEVTCTSLDPAYLADATVTWDFGDGGGPVEGVDARRILPAGLTGYAVRRAVLREKKVEVERRTLPLDERSFASCPPEVRVGGEAPFEDRALPARPAGKTAYRIAVLSDGNGPYGAIPQAEGVDAAVEALVDVIRPDLVVYNGDFIAGQKRGIGKRQLRAMWAEYLRVVHQPLRRAGIPLVPVPGNHDASPSRLLHDRAVFRAVWSRPEIKPALDFVDAKGYPFRFAFRAGGAVLAVLDAPTGRTDKKAPAWLDGVLATPAPSRLVFAHVPPWQPTARAYGTLRRWPDLAQVLRARRVDLLLTGHYEMFYPTVLDGVEVVLDGTLAAACGRLGDGRPGCRCRPLTGTALCQGMSFVVLDLVEGRVVRRFAVHGPDFDRVLPSAFLPAQVGEQALAPGWR